MWSGHWKLLKSLKRRRPHHPIVTGAKVQFEQKKCQGKRLFCPAWATEFDNYDDNFHLPNSLMVFESPSFPTLLQVHVFTDDHLSLAMHPKPRAAAPSGLLNFGTLLVLCLATN